MAIHFVDGSAPGAADNNTGVQGHTLDLPWATYEWAMESGALVAGDSITVRPTHSEIPTSDISIAYDGTASNPIKSFGCPRSAHAISSSDWTNGSTAVVNDDADLDRNEHQSRYITAPDGEIYFITRVVDASNFVIDREYAGSTVSNDATASIDADESQPDWDNYDDSADTIKKADWEASNARPIIDFNDGAFQLYIFTDDYHHFYNMEFKDSADTLGIIRNYRSQNTYFEGCLIKQSANNTVLFVSTSSLPKFKRSTFEGSGAGNAQVGMRGGGVLEDVAIYNMGDHGLDNGNFYINNVNVGVEIANGDDDISTYGNITKGRDLKLGGTNGLIAQQATGYGSVITEGIFIENYQKILGAHRTFIHSGYYEKAAVSGEVPNKKISDNILKIVPSTNIRPMSEFATPVLVHELEMTADTHNLKYWIYNNMGATINDGDAKGDIWLKVESIPAYDDTSEYVITNLFSAENTIADAADADDWDSLSVAITTAIAGKVRVTIYLNTYSAAGTLFVDPAVVIS